MRTPELSIQSIRWLLAELAVVVIGILLAFQIEDWRASVADKEFANANLGEVLLELEDEFSDFENVIPRLEINLSSSSKIIDIMKSDTVHTENELLAAYQGIFSSYQWLPNSSTYSGLRESGRLYLISDTALVSQLFDYYGFSEYVKGLYEGVSAARRRLRSASILDVQRVPSQYDPIDSTPTALRLELVTSMEQFPISPEFSGILGDYIGLVLSAKEQLNELSDRNLALRKAIVNYLSNSDATDT